MMSMPSHRPSNEIDTVFAAAALPTHIASAAALIRRAVFIDRFLNNLEFASGQSVDRAARRRKGPRRGTEPRRIMVQRPTHEAFEIAPVDHTHWHILDISAHRCS